MASLFSGAPFKVAGKLHVTEEDLAAAYGIHIDPSASSGDRQAAEILQQKEAIIKSMPLRKKGRLVSPGNMPPPLQARHRPQSEAQDQATYIDSPEKASQRSSSSQDSDPAIQSQHAYM